ncbi:MAG: glycosyltransferase [Phycisphaeraceae bacterium]|nr:glycosyltransferase family 4 protein [Phycisphaerales bacterium]MCB9841936.1 glycosyltransferase [Phycisphaeraceae bacterium]
MKSHGAHDHLSVAFLSTYPPTQCGIATFTRDLSRAIVGADPDISRTIVAMDKPNESLVYPDYTERRIRRGVKMDYIRAAESVSYSDVGVVSVQHEYGIFGGADGALVLDFLAHLDKPSIATLHTVLREPSKGQREVVVKMSDRCAKLVVMSHLACDLLDRHYKVPRERVQVIPHGIPDLPFDDPEEHKRLFGMSGRRMALTFGLLSPGKGIETVITALPRVVERYPDLRYFVVGATHPEIRARSGEEYRNALERLAQDLGVSDHIVFRNKFVDLPELCQYLQAADVYITPYLNEAQITSGTLAYAMGSGAAVLSTPYWHAQELLADGRGRLFHFKDDEALARQMIDLFDHPDELNAMRRKAYDYSRAMTWSAVGSAYADLLRRASTEEVAAISPPVIGRSASIPELRLDHVRRLTDDTGMFQFAKYTLPDRTHGYCVDDNARALLVALLAFRITGNTEALRLAGIYLSYMHHSQCADGAFHNFMSYNRVHVQEEDFSDDCIGRSLWALGACWQISPDQGARRLAREMLERTAPLALKCGPRGIALSIMGLDAFIEGGEAPGWAHEMTQTLGRQLLDRYQSERADDWRWFESELTYDNAMLSLALMRAAKRLNDEHMMDAARESLDFIEELCFREGFLQLIGNEGWHQRDSTPATHDEQPIDAAAMVLAFRYAFICTHDRHYLERMRESFSWFLGANRLGLSLYDFATAGCRDGLTRESVNENQGAESTLSFLLALLAVIDLAGESLPDQAQTAAAIG